MIESDHFMMIGNANSNPLKSGELGGMPLPQLCQLAKQSEDEADFLTARAALEEARRRLPQHPAVLLDLIKVHRKLRDHEALEECLKAAWAILRESPADLDHLGEALQEIGEHALAFQTFAMLQSFRMPEVRAVGRARECALHLRLGSRTEATEACAEACVLSPHIPETRSAHALLLQDSDPEKAADLLNDLSRPKAGVPPSFTATCGHRLATALDKLGRHNEAIAALVCAKELECRSLPQIQAMRSQREAWKTWHVSLADFNSEDAERWLKRSPSGPASAFLLGHPRSGTTLLEQILDANPRIRSVEESDFFAEWVAKRLIKMHGENPNPPEFRGFLDQLSNGQQEEVARRYFEEMERETSINPQGTIWLDKNPGLTIVVPLIARILPHSRLVVALRDPRDVCLSAYFQAHHRNTWSCNWLTLEETVNQYVFAMGLWLEARSKLAQPWLEVRYEDLIRDPVSEGVKVTRFLGLDWHPAQEDPTSHAKNRLIRSPTHADVIRPIYQNAAGRWKNYQSHFAPFTEKLAPFINAFGYEA